MTVDGGQTVHRPSSTVLLDLLCVLGLCLPVRSLVPLFEEGRRVTGLVVPRSTPPGPLPSVAPAPRPWPEQRPQQPEEQEKEEQRQQQAKAAEAEPKGPVVEGRAEVMVRVEATAAFGDEGRQLVALQQSLRHAGLVRVDAERRHARQDDERQENGKNDPSGHAVLLF